MNGGALVGLDIGSTVVKAAAFDMAGRLTACASRPVPIVRPQPSWIERDSEGTWAAAAAVLRSVAARAGRVAAVGVTGCGNGAVLVGSGGRAVRRGILSGDTRAVGMLGTRRGPGHARGFAGQTAVLLSWLAAHEPRAIERTKALLFWKDFIRLRLTGEICTDFTDAGASGLLDSRKMAWLNPRGILPPLRASTDRAGEITREASRRVGLPTGTPVFTGAFDCEAAALGSGIAKEGDLSVVAGTWAINQTFSRRPSRAGQVLLCNPSAQPGRWLLLEGGPGSAANFEWAARALLGRQDLGRALRMAAGGRAGGLTFVPGVSIGKGAFAGLDATHHASDLLRAVMEGVVYGHRVQIEALTASGLAFTRIRFAGGASKSPLWCQLYADGLGLPLEVPEGEELGALGAALCAGVGMGRWRSLAQAQRETVRVARSFSPAARGLESMELGYGRFRDAKSKLGIQ
jgi:L-xylulokinase